MDFINIIAKSIIIFHRQIIEYPARTVLYCTVLWGGVVTIHGNVIASYDMHISTYSRPAFDDKYSTQKS